MWVETCFLGKGLSPSKLSTKALCGDTRKRGNEKPEGGREREAVLSKSDFSVVPAAMTSLDLQTSGADALRSPAESC